MTFDAKVCYTASIMKYPVKIYIDGRIMYDAVTVGGLSYLDRAGIRYEFLDTEVVEDAEARKDS